MKSCMRIPLLAGTIMVVVMIAAVASGDDSLFFHFNGNDWIDTTGLTGPSPTYAEGWLFGDCWGAVGSGRYCFSIPSHLVIKGVRVMWFGKDACHFHGSSGGVLSIWDHLDSEWDEIEEIRWNEPLPDEYWTHDWISDVARYCDNYCFILFSALELDRYELRDGYFVALYETGIEEGAVTGDRLRPQLLSQNEPNPFRFRTSIAYQIPSNSNVTLKVYDSSGGLVKVLVDGRVDCGRHIVHWDGRDEGGLELASGVYFYRLEADDFTDMKKMVVAR